MTVRGSTETIKRPGDLCFGTKGELLIVDEGGTPRPGEQPHRRDARERAEAFRKKVNGSLAELHERRSLFSFFRGA